MRRNKGGKELKKCVFENWKVMNGDKMEGKRKK
jgi:hypothetical protein